MNECLKEISIYGKPMQMNGISNRECTAHTRTYTICCNRNSFPMLCVSFFPFLFLGCMHYLCIRFECAVHPCHTYVFISYSCIPHIRSEHHRRTQTVSTTHSIMLHCMSHAPEIDLRFYLCECMCVVFDVHTLFQNALFILR